MTRGARSDAGSFRLRAGFAFLLLLGGAGGLLARAVDLQLVNPDFFKKEGDARFEREVSTDAGRGSIFDRNGEPLAVSTPVESAFAVPQELAAVPAERWNDLARALHRDPADFSQRLSRSQDRSFLWLARKLAPKEAQAVRELDIPGVYFRQESQRYYPQAEVTGHVLGVTDIDDMGQEGVELAWDSQLAGEPGRKRVIQDRLGRVVEDVENIRTARPGRDVVLSLDSRIQYVAYRELKRAIEANRASSGSIVVIDVTTGEILAMVDQPAFNPNDRAQRKPENYKNLAATDYLEPGSSIKPFVVAAALESGRFDATSMIDTSPIDIGGEPLVDEHPLGTIGLATVLAKSSNVGMAKIALELEPRQIWTTLSQFGFGRVTASRFPGESAGTLSNYSEWRKVEIASLSRGYHIGVTPLQLAQAYATIGALGVARPVSLEYVDHPVAGERVISEHNARTLVSLLEGVVREGTGTKAAIPGYRVAGKTGTAKKADNGYYDDHYIAVFGGVAPASNPRLAAVVVINDPAAGQYYGGDVSAPVFSAVVGGALRLLGVAPDNAGGAAQDPSTGIATMVSR
ncbi:MAG TPA: penicillin-binding transpeptidase domain-containing protein [Steroidobacteraceae bacterium]|nr:penicillin-binding transpeptidase domain-containing protein [Steroidobacteraceae bacterium]